MKSAINDRTSESVICIPRRVVMIHVIKFKYYYNNKKGKTSSFKSYIRAASIVHHIAISQSERSNTNFVCTYGSTQNFIPTSYFSLMLHCNLCFSLLANRIIKLKIVRCVSIIDLILYRNRKRINLNTINSIWYHLILFTTLQTIIHHL